MIYVVSYLYFLCIFADTWAQVTVSMFVEESNEENRRMFACFYYLLSLLRRNIDITTSLFESLIDVREAGGAQT